MDVHQKYILDTQGTFCNLETNKAMMTNVCRQTGHCNISTSPMTEWDIVSNGPLAQWRGLLGAIPLGVGTCSVPTRKVKNLTLFTVNKPTHQISLFS